MLKVETRLICDGCQNAYGNVGVYSVPVLRKQLEEIRRRALDFRWGHYRLTNTSSIGDYCPRCVKKHQTARATKTAAGKRGGG